MISQVNDFTEQLHSARCHIRDDLIETRKAQAADSPDAQNTFKVPELHEVEVPVDERTVAISSIINLLSRGAIYSQASSSWVLLENIVKYTWNMITYELISPLELSRTDAYKDVSLLTECVLNLLSHAKLSNTLDVQQDEAERPSVDRTVKFEDEHKAQPAVSKTVLLNDGDIKLYSNFVAYSIQCLFVAQKWESMVDLADLSSKQLLTICTDPDDELLFLLAYLLQFRIYAENKLYEVARAKTEQVKQALKARIDEFKHWKATSKKSKSSQALLTGELPEETQFRQDKQALEQETFRLEVHETILKSDREESELALDRIRKSANNTKESLRQCRKFYKTFAVQTKALDAELEAHPNSKMMAGKVKSHSVMINMIIGSYNKTIELIKKRQEKYLLIQSLHEIGNLYYSDGQLKHAETQWND